MCWGKWQKYLHYHILWIPLSTGNHGIWPLRKRKMWPCALCTNMPWTTTNNSYQLTHNKVLQAIRGQNWDSVQYYFRLVKGRGQRALMIFVSTIVMPYHYTAFKGALYDLAVNGHRPPPPFPLLSWLSLSWANFNCSVSQFLFVHWLESGLLSLCAHMFIFYVYDACVIKFVYLFKASVTQPIKEILSDDYNHHSFTRFCFNQQLPLPPFAISLSCFWHHPELFLAPSRGSAW